MHFQVLVIFLCGLQFFDRIWAKLGAPPLLESCPRLSRNVPKGLEFCQNFGPNFEKFRRWARSPTNMREFEEHDKHELKRKPICSKIQKFKKFQPQNPLLNPKIPFSTILGSFWEPLFRRQKSRRQLKMSKT